MRRRGRLAGTHAVSHDECARWRIVTSYMRGRLAPRPQEELALLMRRCGIRPRLLAAPPAAGARGCHCFSPHACFADARPDTVGSGSGGWGVGGGRRDWSSRRARVAIGLSPDGRRRVLRCAGHRQKHQATAAAPPPHLALAPRQCSLLPGCPLHTQVGIKRLLWGLSPRAVTCNRS